MSLESKEPQMIFNAQAELEKLEGVSGVEKIELNEQYFEWARTNMDSHEYELIKANYESLDAYKFKYLSDGLKIAAYSWMPKDITEKTQLVVWNRGGVRAYSSIGNSEGKDGLLYSNFPCELAKLNAIVVGSEYRGGLDSEGEDEWGGRDVDDVAHLREITRKLPVVKSGKTIVVGGSRGGAMSYLLASREPWVGGVVSLAGAADLKMSSEARPEMKEVFTECFGGSDEEMAKRSATHFYNQIPKDLPMLIMQGAEDDRVSVTQVRKLVDLLKSSEHNVEYHEFPDGGHGFYLPGRTNSGKAIQVIKNFIQKNSK